MWHPWDGRTKYFFRGISVDLNDLSLLLNVSCGITMLHDQVVRRVSEDTAKHFK